MKKKGEKKGWYFCALLMLDVVFDLQICHDTIQNPCFHSFSKTKLSSKQKEKYSSRLHGP